MCFRPMSVPTSESMNSTSDRRGLFDASESLWQYVTPLLVFPGTFSNVVCIITLQTKSFRGSATAFLLTALAVVDTVSLLVGALHIWVIHVFSLEVRIMSDPTCRIHSFLTYLSVQLSAWTLVLVTLERVVSVTCPMETPTLCSRRRLVGVWIVLFCILASLNAYIHLANMELHEQFFPMEDNSTFHVRECTVRHNASDHFRDMLDHIRVWSDLVLSCLLPSVFIFFGNALVIYKLAQVARRKRQLQSRRSVSNGKTFRTNKRRSSHVTVMLIAVGIVFLITSLPINIFMLGEDIWFFDRYSDLSVFAKRELVYTILSLLYYFNNAINFVLYFVSGTMFRQAAIELFCPSLQVRYRNIRQNLRRSIRTTHTTFGITESAL